MQNYFIPLKKRKKFIYQSGAKFGRLTYTGLTYTKIIYGHWVRFIEAVCDCGVVKEYQCNKVLSGETKSCGCYRKDLSRKSNITHNLSKHPLYDVYKHIISRCYNEKDKVFKNYGGRNIEVWEEWKNDFVGFYDWCIANGYKEGLSVERLDNDGNYAPYNCKLATVAEQSRNKRSTRNYIAFGETKCLFDWAQDERCLVGMWTLRGRADNPIWDGRFEEAMTTPPEDRKAISSRSKRLINITAFGETKCISDWHKDSRCVVGLDGLRDRIKNGWHGEKAISTPLVKGGTLTISAFGENKSMTDWLKDVRCVVNVDALRDRLRNKWDAEKAITTPSKTGIKNIKRLTP